MRRYLYCILYIYIYIYGEWALMEAGKSQTGVQEQDVIVVQDGALPSVAAIVEEHGLHLKQNTRKHCARGLMVVF